jgi:transposase
MGAYLRRMKSTIGPAAATTATAHKIAIVFYTMIKRQVEYDETIWARRDTDRLKYWETKLKRQAKQLGYELIPIEEKPAA